MLAARVIGMNTLSRDTYQRTVLRSNSWWSRQCGAGELDLAILSRPLAWSASTNWPVVHTHRSRRGDVDDGAEARARDPEMVPAIGLKEVTELLRKIRYRRKTCPKPPRTSRIVRARATPPGRREAEEAPGCTQSARSSDRRARGSDQFAGVPAHRENRCRSRRCDTCAIRVALTQRQISRVSPFDLSVSLPRHGVMARRQYPIVVLPMVVGFSA